ncbi:MAG: phosphoribosyltransferase [Deltaproteobacteria bacterium]|nr:phosphoribosyltransferase [Deltaproteobacteria bacterium]
MTCKIFLNPDTNRTIDSNPESIITLGSYFPQRGKHYSDLDNFSNLVLHIKKDEDRLNKVSGEEYHYNKAIKQFIDLLRSMLSYKDEYVICVMPSHKKGTKPTGIRRIAKELCSPPVINGTNVLSRKFELQKKSTGGARDLQKEIESLTVEDKGVIKDKQVLLIDDVTTSGTSLVAGRMVLKNAGAELVALFALGKTED